MITDIQIPFETASIPAYYTIPDDSRQHPAIILIHEIWGLNDHIKDIANRLQAQGYAVLAPDLLSGVGISEKIGTKLFQEMQNPATKDEAQKELRNFFAPINSPEFAEATMKKLKTCFSYLHAQENSNSKIGVIGFCFGGTYAFALAAAQPDIKAAVPFYGHAPEPLSTIQAIACPVLAFYGGQDTELMKQLPGLKDAMILYHKQFLAVEYPDCGHAFFNDTNPNRYNKEAAEDAWERVLEFLKINLE